jgi:carbonic anhydrase
MNNPVSLFLLFTVFFLSACRQQGTVQEVSIPADPLERLIEGNQRFRDFHPLHPDQTRGKMRELTGGQHPFAVVLSCSDSRVPPELVFDQGLGDLFVIRTAGHLVDNYELGSIEYAVEHLGVKLIVVLGHEQCGAVQAFIEHRNDSLPGHIQDLMNALKAEMEEEPDIRDPNAGIDKAVRANIHHVTGQLKEDELIAHHPDVRIVGALYHLADGAVDFIY